MAEAPAQQFEFKELEKFQMYTDAPGVPGKRSRLIFSSYRGNPRITVFTGVPGDSHKGVMNAPMNPETFLIFLNMLEKVAKTPDESEYTIVCDTLPKAEEGKQRSNEKIHLADVKFGRDSQGVVYISVQGKNRPLIFFKFKVSDFHKLLKKDGVPFNEMESSSLQALASLQGIRDAIGSHMGVLKAPFVPGEKSANVSNSFSSTVKEDFKDITF
jgi:hypothetical protein